MAWVPERGASVNKKPSMVAMSGAIIAAPLAIPKRTTVAPSASRTVRLLTLGTVSVVIMAREALSRWVESCPSELHACWMPLRTSSMGRNRPITPVLATKADPGSKPSVFSTRWVISRASAKPLSPVQALALPEEATTARKGVPWPWGRRFRQRATGAAKTRFWVKTPAATAGRSLSQTATSRRPGSPEAPRIPHGTPLNDQPKGIRCVIFLA